MLRLRIIRNPRAAGGRKAALFEAVIARLSDSGAAIEVLETTQAGDAARYAGDATTATTDRIVIAGGDGTINDALQGFHADSPPFAILPMGTANVLSHELGLTASAEALARYVLTGLPEVVYPGRINDRRFLSVASAGSDAQTVADLPRGAKRRWGKLSYVIYGLASFARRGCPEFNVRVDGALHPVSVVIANRGTRYGGNHVLAPLARMSDPQMVVTLLPPGGRVATFGRLVAIGLGLGRRPGWFRQIPCTRLDISAPVGAPIQGDGDIVGRLPAAVTVDPTPLRLIRPE